MTRRSMALVLGTLLVAAGSLPGVAAAAAPAKRAAPAKTPATPNATRPRALAANFVSPCRYSHSAPDDPIVKPNQPGGAHQHDFFANTTTNASSTETSLLAGTTTCRRRLDTAAYWTPALSDGGKVVQPTTVSAYYLTGGKQPASIKPFPAGLRLVAGPGPGISQWACRAAGRDVASSMTAAPECSPGAELVVRVFFPDCWNGRDLDSVDHRSHLTYSVRGKCPTTHPVPVPRLRLGFHYPGANGGSDVTLSSGDTASAHADFFNTWDQAELTRLVKTCLNAGIQCGGPAKEAAKRR